MKIDNTYVGEIEHEFYGDTWGSCAWCSKHLANKWYTTLILDDELALYHVCNSCFNERIGQ